MIERRPVTPGEPNPDYRAMIANLKAAAEAHPGVRYFQRSRDNTFTPASGRAVETRAPMLELERLEAEMGLL